MHKVFVYGTLRKDCSNHHYLKKAICLSDSCWTYGKMYDTGRGYPAIQPSKLLKITGELYEVSEQVLLLINELEDYQPGRKENLYERVSQIIYGKDKQWDALVYIAGSLLTNLHLEIHQGDWLGYRNRFN